MLVEGWVGIFSFDDGASLVTECLVVGGAFTSEGEWRNASVDGGLDWVLYIRKIENLMWYVWIVRFTFAEYMKSNGEGPGWGRRFSKNEELWLWWIGRAFNL